MPAVDRVRPLEAVFQEVIDAVLRKRGSPTTADVTALGPRVSALSQGYNTGLPAKAPLEARIAFSFARDVPKGAAAVRELLGTGALGSTGERTLRIVDL